MNTALIVGIIAGTTALASAIGTIVASIYNSKQTNRMSLEIARLKDSADESERRQKRSDEMARYSEPLLRSAYDLQSRIFNIVAQQVLYAFYQNLAGREHKYYVENTSFLFAQYFCWTEIGRRQIRFIDLGEDSKTKRLLYLQDKLFSTFGSDKIQFGFQLFAGEQRAIGEALISSDEQGPTCMGYGEFLSKFKHGNHELIDTLRENISDIASKPKFETSRLRMIQHDLVDIIDLLDPNCIRYPLGRRTKLP